MTGKEAAQSVGPMKRDFDKGAVRRLLEKGERNGNEARG